jgi:hypothetical protein
MAELEKVTVATNPCVMCGNRSYVEVDAADFERWQAGEHVQNVWPKATPGWREVLITGTHPECWDKMFADEEES